MKRAELEELHYITPIVNVPLIITGGILSHNRVEQVQHESIAMQEIQKRRSKVVVPGGRPLHDYANIYFHARNPMMYVCRENHTSLCVLRISTDVLDLPGAVVTDSNASSDYVRFSGASKGLSIVQSDLVFAENWNYLELYEYYRRKSAKCAEVLVPDKIDPMYLTGIYVSSNEGYSNLTAILVDLSCNLQLSIYGHLFFL